MPVFTSGKMVGIVGFKQLYPDTEMPKLKELLKGLPRIWAIRLVSNMQNKLVGKPFYNPSFQGEETTQIDVPRFFFGPQNKEWTYDTIERYKAYVAFEKQAKQQPMECAAGSETPLLLLKHIMSLPESKSAGDIAILERNLYTAFMVANEKTMNREQGKPPYKPEEDLEMYLAGLLMSRYAYNDFTDQKRELDDLLRNQVSRTERFFNFVSQHPQLVDIYDSFLKGYGLTSWSDYLRTYLSIQALARYKTGVVNFEKLEDVDGLLTEQIVERDSIDIHQIIALTDNVDYVAFREKPFIKIRAHEYAVIDVSFMIYRMFDGLYFIFNDLWKKCNPDNPNGFNRLFATEFSEETVLVDALKGVADANGWLSLTDKECKQLVPEKRLSSPPDFYIRDGEDIILFECKDVKIRKEIKAEGTTEQLLELVDQDFVGYQDDRGKWRYKGVGQLVRNAKRIQDGKFDWDKEADKNSRLFLVLVLADARQVAAGWKNYLNRRMFEECVRQKVDVSRVCPLILTDLGTLVLYKYNFIKNGFLRYFVDYYNKTVFNPRKIESGDKMTNIMNQTLSFSGYMNGERLMGGEKLRKSVLGVALKRPKEIGHHSYVTKTVEYADLFDDEVKEALLYLSGINKKWLIEGVVHMISVDCFDSFSMRADKGLLVMFQDYRSRNEVKRLFNRLKDEEQKYGGAWLTLINHQALYKLLRKVLMMPNERNGKGESCEAYMALLKAILAENTIEMERERLMLSKVDGDTETKDATIIMQQDVLNIDQFGENKKEIEKAQMLKLLAINNFGKQHKEVGNAIQRVIGKHGFKNVYDYLLQGQMPLSVYHDKNHFGEGLYYVRRQDFEEQNALRLWDGFVNYVSDKCIDIWDTGRMESIFAEKELLDNTCFRKHPVLKMSEDEYVIVSSTYYAHLFFDGFWWSLKEELKNSMSDKAIMNLLTKEFSEKRLFCDLVAQMPSDKRIRIYNEHCFDDQQASPDIAFRTRRHLFLFEYKDMRVPRREADGSDINLLLAYIDERLNKEKSKGSGNKGLPQLVSDMEDYFTGKKPWGNDFRKGNVKLHPILVVNSRLFGVRGINFILKQKLLQRIEESEILRTHKKEIGDLLVMDYDMLILVASRAYRNHAMFHNFLYSYVTHLRNSKGSMNQYDSYRHYVMNRWEREMTEIDKKRFKVGYKHIVTSMA